MRKDGREDGDNTEVLSTRDAQVGLLRASLAEVPKLFSPPLLHIEAPDPSSRDDLWQSLCVLNEYAAAMGQALGPMRDTPYPLHLHPAARHGLPRNWIREFGFDKAKDGRAPFTSSAYDDSDDDEDEEEDNFDEPAK